MNLEEKRKKNTKLYPIYKMFAWDLLFYYAVSFLFLTDVKGFSSADVVLLDVSIYTLFKFISQLPATILTDKLGKRTSLIVGNSFICISIFFILLCTNLYWLALAEFFMAFGYVVKSIAEPNILYDALPSSEERRKQFSKLDGRGSSFYYYFNAISALVTGFLYLLNPYLPIVLCFLICVFATYLSTQFCSLHSTQVASQSPKVPKASQRLQEYFKQLRYIFRHIFKSKRLKCLIVFYALFQTLISVTKTLDRSLLTDLQVSPAYFGIIYAALSILSGVASYSQNIFHRTLRNRVLTVFSVFFIGSCFISGLMVIMGVPFSVSIVLILLSFAVRDIIKGPFYTLYKRYLNSFSTSTVRTKIYSATYLFENLCGALIAFFISRLLEFTSTSVAFVVLASSYTIAFIFLLHYMKSHVGLKPEEYRKEDIDLVDVK